MRQLESLPLIRLCSQFLTTINFSEHCQIKGKLSEDWFGKENGTKSALLILPPSGGLFVRLPLKYGSKSFRMKMFLGIVNYHGRLSSYINAILRVPC